MTKFFNLQLQKKKILSSGLTATLFFIIFISSSSPAAFAKPFFPRLPCSGAAPSLDHREFRAEDESSLSSSSETELFYVYRSLEEVVEEFLNLYESYTDPVVEVMDAVVLHQLSGIAKSFLKVVESFRLILCSVVCADACNPGGVSAADSSSGGTYFIDHWITELHRNVECISNKQDWRLQVSDFMFTKWAQIRAWLEQATVKLHVY